MAFETHYEGMAIPQCWQTLEKVLAAGIDRVILYGPPGTGKTYGGLTMGLNGAGSDRLVCTEDMTSANVEGMWMPNKEGTFSYLDGAATRAWRKGSRLVIDEIDKASGDVSALLLTYTDSVASASHDLPTGEKITPTHGFSVVMTSNVEDPDDLPMALRDRFPVAIEISAPHPAALMSLSSDLRTVAAQVVAAPQGRRASLRAFYAFEQLRKVFTVTEAAQVAFGAELAESIVDSVHIGNLGYSDL